MQQQAIIIQKREPVSPEVEEVAFANMTSFHDRLGEIMTQAIECEAELEMVHGQLHALTTDMQAFCNSLLEGHTRAQPGIFGSHLHIAEGAQAATA